VSATSLNVAECNETVGDQAAWWLD